jgi:2-polyprenyl-3-methyl-5-hydroxy-6-metoxy-1,4-benzoquinol methylase
MISDSSTFSNDLVGAGVFGDMRVLDAIEERIWNVGERLIPGVTHDTAEVIRHKSSYLFFRKVIERDLLSTSGAKPKVHILDLGCGVGHGSYMLADIPGAVVTGLDCSEEAIFYARLHYSRENVSYLVADAVTYIKEMPEFDYVVSRHSLEHIPGGLELGADCKFAVRLMVNVPFGESEKNPHHHVHYIRQDSFEKYLKRELFYEDLDGVTFCEYSQKTPNSIICVSSRDGLPDVTSRFSFPLPAWRPEFLQGRWLEAVDQQSDLHAVTQQQAARDQELSGRETNLAVREGEIALRESQCGRREYELGTLENQLAAREARCNARESELVTREGRVAENETICSMGLGEIQAQRAELDRQDSLLSEREARLAGRQAELDVQSQKFESRLIVRAYRKIRTLL